MHIWQRRSWLLPSTFDIRCRHPAPGQDLIPLQRLHVFAHSRDPHPAIKLWCQVSFTKSKTIFQIETYCMQCSAFWKANISKVELSLTKIGELLRKLWSLRCCFLILPPGALTPQGIKGAMKRDVSKDWCTFQWCASRGWVIAHENWTSCARWRFVLMNLIYLSHRLYFSFVKHEAYRIGGFDVCVVVCLSNIFKSTKDIAVYGR